MVIVRSSGCGDEEQGQGGGRAGVRVWELGSGVWWIEVTLLPCSRGQVR